MCTYSYPVFSLVNGSKKFTGVITMDISLAAFERMVKAIKVFKTGYGFLVSKQGNIITSPRMVTEKKNILDIARAGRGEQTIRAIRDMLAGKTGFSPMDGLEAQSRPGFLSYAPVASTGWSLGVIMPADELLDDLFQFVEMQVIIPSHLLIFIF